MSILPTIEQIFNMYLWHEQMRAKWQLCDIVQWFYFTDESDEKNAIMCFKLQSYLMAEPNLKSMAYSFFCKTVLPECSPQVWNSAIMKCIKGQNLQPESLDSHPCSPTHKLQTLRQVYMILCAFLVFLC